MIGAYEGGNVSLVGERVYNHIDYFGGEVEKLHFVGLDHWKISDVIRLVLYYLCGGSEEVGYVLMDEAQRKFVVPLLGAKSTSNLPCVSTVASVG